jgi:hypothetical protein
MTSWLLGGNEFHVLFGAAAGIAVAVLMHYAGLLLWAAWSRRRLGRREVARVPLSGDWVIHDVIGPRLRSAAHDVTNTHPLAINRSGRRLREETPPITASMQAEARRRSVWLWRENGPLLGPAVARYGAERLVCGYALDRVAAVEDLPVVLRAAVEVDIEWTPRHSSRGRRWCCRQTRR